MIKFIIGFATTWVTKCSWQCETHWIWNFWVSSLHALKDLPTTYVIKEWAVEGLLEAERTASGVMRMCDKGHEWVVIGNSF